MDRLWEERAARNEALFREVNERIGDLANDQYDSAAEFLCECSDAECLARIKVPLAVYEQTRSNPRTFLLAPGHEDPEVETVRVTADQYAIVEKTGAAGAVAEHTNPR